MTSYQFTLNSIAFDITAPPAMAWIMPFFIPQIIPNNQTIIKAVVQVELQLVDTLTPPETTTHFSDSIRQGKGLIWYRFHPNLALTFTHCQADKIAVRVQILYQDNLKTRIKASLGSNTLDFRNNLFVQGIRHGILFPYFFMMNRHHQAALTHGSAFVQQNRGYAILGFDGVGKSTLAALAQEQGLSILSDNFVLMNKEHLFFVPDPLRIRTTKGSHLYGKRFEPLPFYQESIARQQQCFITLGDSYRFHPDGALTLTDFNHLVFSELIEFYDFNRFLTALRLWVPSWPYQRSFPWMDNDKLATCQRATLDDNKRLLNEILSL
ncbi:MAG: hypothetical protein HQL72_05505 [Magnetococcales bacterium]|nr:hypothetical protein [Magnetococcales bacterium]